jgi:ATP-binding cassette subfamily C (CFTR/MRP) protein 1
MVLVTQLPSQATDGGALGVSLTNIVTFSATLTYVIQGWAQLETSMGAVQRVRDFTEQTPSENKSGESRALPLGWGSSRTGVRFDGVTAAYRQVKSLESNDSWLIIDSNFSYAVLKDVTFQIAPGQKVGVCGRTGR